MQLLNKWLEKLNTINKQENIIHLKHNFVNTFKLKS